MSPAVNFHGDGKEKRGFEFEYLIQFIIGFFTVLRMESISTRKLYYFYFKLVKKLVRN